MSRMKRANCNKKEHGFSILEVVVSLGLLTVGILTALSLSSSGIEEAMYAKEQVTAFYLAQEAIEYVRNARDNNDNSQPKNWLEDPAGIDLKNCIIGNVGCTVDVIKGGIENYNQVDDIPFLKFDNANKYYNYVSGDDTVFKRWVKIDKLSTGDGDKEAQVTVTVSWRPKNVTSDRNIVLEEHLFNIK